MGPVADVSRRADFVEENGVIFFSELQMDVLCFRDFARLMEDLLVIAMRRVLHADAVE